MELIAVSTADAPKRSPIRTCDICGQTYDTANLDQVFHHDANAHERLPLPDFQSANEKSTGADAKR